MEFSDRFEIDVITALSEQLVQALKDLSPGGLTAANIESVLPEEGVYVLFHKKKLVYVGRAENLRKRLGDHMKKIGGRLGIQLSDMRFKCLYVHKNWTALAPEKALIEHFKGQRGRGSWNGIGFGPHDPGRNRETTNKPPDGFDDQYPIHADIPCTWIERGDWNIRALLIELKKGLPFLLRYQVKAHFRSGHSNYNRRTITLPSDAMPARLILAKVAKALPGWQATVFSSHMILYKERRRYKYGKVLNRNTPA